MDAAATAHTILVVDAERGIRSVIAIVLSAQGYRLLEAANGEEALRWLRQGETVDLLLADMHLPGLSFSELVNRWKEQPERPVIGMTAGDSTNLVHDHNGVRVIEKPFSVERLADLVRELLSGENGQSP
ncbi:MAG: response regulator [Gemmataceae bacterium]